MLAKWLIGAAVSTNGNDVPVNVWLTIAKIKVIFTGERLPNGSSNSLRITMDNGYWVGTEEREVYCEETNTTVVMNSDSSRDFKKEDFSLNENIEYTLVLRIKFLTGKPVYERLLQELRILGPALTKVTEFGIVPVLHPLFFDYGAYYAAYSTNLVFVTSDGPIGITSMYVTFLGCSSLNSDLAGWDVHQVTQFADCFRECVVFNGDITAWNTSSAVEMQKMFYGASSFNRNISSWAVNNVNNMEQMFRDASVFNQNLSSWYVPLIPIEPLEFQYNTSSWTLPKPQWGVSPP